MTRRSLVLLLVAAGVLVSCSALDPYPVPARAPQPGQPAGPRIAVCYNTLTTTLAEAQTQAQRECRAGKFAEPADTDWYLQHCPLLLPARATFVCTQKK